MPKESLTAFFHNQKDFYPNNNQSFNQLYASHSPELNSEYDPEKAENQFQPILEILDQKFISIKDLTILEIGGSSGILSRKLQDKGGNVTMLETEEVFVEKAKERGVNAHLYNGHNLLSIIHNYQFDIIAANRVFEDIVMSEYQAKRLLVQVNKLLKPNGIFVIGTQNPDAVWENIFIFSGLKKIITNPSPFHSYIKQTSVYSKK